MSAPESRGPMSNGVDGASAERTRLAWRRTVLATTVVSLLTVRLAVRDGVTPVKAVVVAAALLGWLAQLWVTQRRIQMMAQPKPGGIGRTLPAISLVIVGYAVLGIVLLIAA